MIISLFELNFSFLLDYKGYLYVLEIFYNRSWALDMFFFTGVYFFSYIEAEAIFLIESGLRVYY